MAIYLEDSKRVFLPAQEESSFSLHPLAYALSNEKRGSILKLFRLFFKTLQVSMRNYEKHEDLLSRSIDSFHKASLEHKRISLIPNAVKLLEDLKELPTKLQEDYEENKHNPTQLAKRLIVDLGTPFTYSVVDFIDECHEVRLIHLGKLAKVTDNLASGLLMVMGINKTEKAISTLAQKEITSFQKNLAKIKLLSGLTSLVVITISVATKTFKFLFPSALFLTLLTFFEGVRLSEFIYEHYHTPKEKAVTLRNASKPFLY